MTTEGPTLGATCPACSALARAGARFCRECGANLGPFQPTAGSSGQSVAQSKEAVGAAPHQISASTLLPPPPNTEAKAPRDRSIRTSLTNPVAMAGGAIVLVALAGAAIFLLLDHRHSLTATPKVQEFVTRLVRVRNATNVSGSVVLGDLERGDSVSGDWVTAADGRNEWLKIKWKGDQDGYVWGRNLSPTAPPALTVRIGRTLTLSSEASVTDSFRADAPVVEQHASGERLTVVGEVAGGWDEIALDNGGVGYVPTSAFQAQVADSADTIPAVCPPFTTAGAACRLGTGGSAWIGFAGPAVGLKYCWDQPYSDFAAIQYLDGANNPFFWNPGLPAGTLVSAYKFVPKQPMVITYRLAPVCQQ